MSSAHYLALRQVAIQLMRRYEIEIFAEVSENLLAWWQTPLQNSEHVGGLLSEGMIECRPVECFFVSEVIVEQRLVDLGSAGNGIGTGAINAVRRKFLYRSMEDRLTSFFGLAARA